MSPIYKSAMAILNKLTTRDWELESAARQYRLARTEREQEYAENNLKDILRRRF